ncbi:hypothetical protein D2E64_11360 [Mycobacteroides abscessus]|uniref:hypothetical protein n=1 Tax=Mycobacteroides abscessus TaxID=36809 RepID=UPI00031B13F7|nr:hypothetical protein [Mycobacteroides abscessus]MBN7567113.1 hypothetical protein [Mycobacteroides abscessus subsp. massiliense]PVA72298.1 hypothetical protein DDJ76_23165 [Mycobacteroides abscessus]RIS03971.1 hypothetical protein D2E63_22790 [Mycobacteroides abscessus]RIS11273.1 hypothetical protein D2E69_22020 [Mycobacteroides abscessus]RIS23623.1 hypothetical protein D2E67_22435 [Mycobacteroides abscessus]
MDRKPPRKTHGPSGIKHGSEERQAEKFVGKRVTKAEQQLLHALAKSKGVPLSALIAPHIDGLLADARDLASRGELVLAS